MMAIWPVLTTLEISSKRTGTNGGLLGTSVEGNEAALSMPKTTIVWWLKSSFTCTLDIYKSIPHTLSSIVVADEDIQ